MLSSKKLYKFRTLKNKSMENKLQQCRLCSPRHSFFEYERNQVTNTDNVTSLPQGFQVKQEVCSIGLLQLTLFLFQENYMFDQKILTVSILVPFLPFVALVVYTKKMKLQQASSFFYFAFFFFNLFFGLFQRFSFDSKTILSLF